MQPIPPRRTGPASPSRSPAESSTRLASLKKTTAREFDRRQRTERRFATPHVTHGRSWWRSALLILALAVLPFLVLVRVAAWTYGSVHAPTWVALVVGALLTLAVIGSYGIRISASLTGRARVRHVFTRIALPITLVYCGYALLYLSSANAKNDTVRAYYTSLHPIVRLALSTAILFDGDLVVTDVRRIPSDYVAMGLPVYEASLHYRQADGYVHAVDLRTIGRPAWRNGATALFLRLMGLRTRRHVGTADHLHVSLPGR